MCCEEKESESFYETTWDFMRRALLARRVNFTRFSGDKITECSGSKLGEQTSKRIFRWGSSYLYLRDLGTYLIALKSKLSSQRDLSKSKSKNPALVLHFSAWGIATGTNWDTHTYPAQPFRPTRAYLQCVYIATSLDTADSKKQAHADAARVWRQPDLWRNNWKRQYWERAPRSHKRCNSLWKAVSTKKHRVS